MLFSPFHSCKHFHSILNSPGHICIKRNIIWEMEFAQFWICSLTRPKGVKKKTGANIPLYTVNKTCLFVFSNVILKQLYMTSWEIQYMQYLLEIKSRFKHWYIINQLATLSYWIYFKKQEMWKMVKNHTEKKTSIFWKIQKIWNKLQTIHVLQLYLFEFGIITLLDGKMCTKLVVLKSLSSIKFDLQLISNH